MTLIHNHEVKEVRRKKISEVFLIIVTHQLLIQREIDLMRGNGTFIVFRGVDLMNHLFQRCKILLNGLIHKDITVSQIENLFLHIALKQTINDLECGISLARTGSHNQQKAILSLGNSINCSVNCNTLIITRRIGILAAIIGLGSNCFLLWCHGGLSFVSSHQLSFRREFVQAKFPLFTGQKIMLCKAITIGAICKRYIQHLCISHCLLQTIRNAVLVVLCLNNRNRVIITEM